MAISVPNERSSHKNPTPQIGGIIIIPGSLFFILFFGEPLQNLGLNGLAIIYAPFVLMLVGFFDDRRGLPISLRLPLFVFVVACVFVWAPELQAARLDYHWVVIFILGFAVLTFVNITNFMDGIDGMLVVEFVPLLTLLLVLTSMGHIKSINSIIPPVLLGCLIGFAILNRPPAKLFMGDAGSLPLGFLIAFLLVQLALEANFISAILPPLYFVADGTITLIRRILRGEKFWLAHRQHAYQRAMDGGQSVISILVRIAIANICLCGLAYFVLDASIQWVFISAILGGMIVFVLLRSLEPRELRQ